MDWLDDAFFEAADRESLDGGTTNLGPLWHGVSPRWGHSMHAMCSYHGMFPARVAHYFIQRFSKPGDLVLDPFSGRGTVPLQARVEGRRAISNDLNPLAFVLTKAKSDPPSWTEIMEAVRDLERQFRDAPRFTPEVPADIRMLFHPNTMQQIAFLRDHLLQREITQWSRNQMMLAGALAGILHGSHRRDGSSRCLSISMPNTFSMSPRYVKNFIREKRLEAPDQDVFECLRDKLSRLYLDSTAGPTGSAFKVDAASWLEGTRVAPSSVDLIITSPPYLKVVNYGTANWIRLWWLGIEDVSRNRGTGRKSLDAALDHQHTYTSYRAFFARTLKGIKRVLRRSGVAVLVIGDVANPGGESLLLARQLWADVGGESGLQLLELIEDHLPIQNKVSRIWGDTKGHATDCDCILVLAREDAELPSGAESVEWDEPYKDGGPDAAHTRFKEIRRAS